MFYSSGYLISLIPVHLLKLQFDAGSVLFYLFSLNFSKKLDLIQNLKKGERTFLLTGEGGWIETEHFSHIYDLKR